jgi:hypothetical protein
MKDSGDKVNTGVSFVLFIVKDSNLCPQIDATNQLQRLMITKFYSVIPSYVIHKPPQLLY